MSASLARILWCLCILWGLSCSRSSEPTETHPKAPTPPAPVVTQASVTAPAPLAIPAEITTACGGCHPVPAPGLFTHRTWGPAIELMYGLLDRFYPQAPDYLAKEKVLAFYRKNAAQTLPAPRGYPSLAPTGPRFGLRSAATLSTRGPIADLRHAPSTVATRPILVTEMLSGHVHRLSGSPPFTAGQPLVTARHPVRSIARDLDQNGSLDLLVAELGVFSADDTTTGAVQRYADIDGTTSRHTLLSTAGRVADLAVANLSGDDLPEIAVAEFGWQKTGALHLYTAHRTPDGAVTYAPKILDSRAGHIAVRAADLDGDGAVDLVTGLAQHHEAIEWWRNQGDGTFVQQPLFEAPHPLWGLIGLEVVDLDQDGDLDILHYNGDVLDAPKVAHFQGVHLMENQGQGRFVSRQLAQMPGIHDLDVADFDGDGRLDIVAVANLPAGIESTLTAPSQASPPPFAFESVLLLRQAKPGLFSVESLLRGAACFSAVLAADPDGDGDNDIVLGGFGMGWSLLGDASVPNRAKEGRRVCEQDRLLWFENGATPAVTADTLAELAGTPPTLIEQIAALATITTHDPANLGYQTLLSDLLLRTGRPQEAMAQLETLLRENPTETVEGFVQACGPQKAPSCTDVARLLFASRTISNGKRHAARLYETGCTRGEAESCVSLAMMHGTGMGVPRRLKKTVYYLDKGCTAAHFGACAKLGEMYGTGDGVKRDPVLAKAYARRACDGGVPTSCAQLPPGEQRPRKPADTPP